MAMMPGPKVHRSDDFFWVFGQELAASAAFLFGASLWRQKKIQGWHLPLKTSAVCFFMPVESTHVSLQRAGISLSLTSGISRTQSLP